MMARYNGLKRKAQKVLDVIEDDTDDDSAQAYIDAYGEYRVASLPEVVLRIIDQAERAERLEGELREARAALEFYANERHYDEAGVVGKAHFSSSPMEPTEYEFEADYGHKARLALGLTTIDPAAVSGEEGE